MRFSSIFSLALAGAVAAAPLAKRDYPTLQADVATISTKLNALHDALANFAGDYNSALAIDGNAQDLLSALQQATTDAQNNGALSASDSADGINALNALVPVVQSTVDLFVQQEPTFKSLQVAGIAKADNASLNSATDAYADALLAIADPSVTAQGQSIKDTIDAAFAKSTAAYANDS